MSFNAAASAPRRRSRITPVKIEKPDTSESDSLTADDDSWRSQSSGTKRASGSSSAPQDGWKHVGPFRKDGIAVLHISRQVDGKQSGFKSSAPRDVLQQYVDVINKYEHEGGKKDNAALMAALRAARAEAAATARWRLAATSTRSGGTSAASTARRTTRESGRLSTCGRPS